MYLALIQSSLGPAFTFIYLVAIIAIPIVLFFELNKKWQKYLHAYYFNKQTYTVLELKIPKNNTKSPLAMEIFLNALQQPGKDYEWRKKWWTGEVRAWFSLEICSFEGNVRFFIWTKTKYKDLLENQLYSQYPDIEISDVGARDYTYNIPFDESKYEYWATEWRKREPSHLPIKTYMAFGLQDDPKEEFRIDPITPLFEFLGSLKKGEQVWYQICVRAHGKDKFDKGKGAYVDWKHAAQKDVLKLTKRDAPNKDDKFNFIILTKGEKQAADAIEDNITKAAFDVGIRVIYAAEKSVYQKSTVGRIKASFNQFNAPNLNSFARVNDIDDDKWRYHYLPFGNKRLSRHKKRLFDLYRHRSFFYRDFVPYPHKEEELISNFWVSDITTWFDSKITTFSAEELATIYHFPGEVAKTPSVNRVTAKKAEPPSNLPQ
ncbi:MAG: hypothetical protein WCG97_00225 [bacterium]